MIQSRNIFLILLYTCTSTSMIIMGKSFAGSRHLRPQFLHWTGSRRAPRQREEGSVTLPFPRTPAKTCLKQQCFGPKSIQMNIPASSVDVSRKMLLPRCFPSAPHPSGLHAATAGREWEQLLASAHLAGRLAGKLLLPAPCRAPHRPLQITTTHPLATGG